MNAMKNPGCGPSKDADTPLHRMLGVLAGPWTIYLIWVLSNEGPMRFGALRRRIEGISTKVLTERLRLLEAEGFVTRHYEPTVPPQVTYSPTHRIAELLPVLRMFCDLSRKWYSEPPAETVPAKKAAQA
ncbi:MAG: winged helix-turn-helix transcriptional regulator [Bacillota bacterium]